MSATFSIRRRVQFSETDMAGVMHFANYFRWMEEVEHEFFRSVGLSVSMMHEGMHIGWPRVAASCEYSGPLKFEEEAQIVLRVTKVGQKSFNYQVEFLHDDKRVALGKMTSVCCAMGKDGFKPIEIPAELRKRLTGKPE